MTNEDFRSTKVGQSNSKPIRSLSISVKVQANSTRTGIAGREGDVFKIRLAAPPVNGKANAALIVFLSEKLGIPQKCISIRKGMSSKRKVVQIENCSQEQWQKFDSEFS